MALAGRYLLGLSRDPHHKTKAFQGRVKPFTKIVFIRRKEIDSMRPPSDIQQIKI